MKRLKRLYNKILEQIENEDIKTIVKDSIVVVRNIFIVLIIILLGFILIPSFEWGWLDRGDMISSISTLIGGFFGLISGIVGIVGTYGAFYLSRKEQQEKENLQKKEELKKLQQQLESTIEHTDILAKSIIDKYIEFYESKNMMEVLYKRIYDKQIVFEYMIEELLLPCIVQENKDRIEELSKLLEENDEDPSLANLTSAYVANVKESEYKALYKDINKIFNEHYNFKSLMFLSDWNRYILHLEDKKEYKISYSQGLLNWFLYLDSNDIESKVKSIEEVNITRITRDGLIKLNNLKVSQITQIMNFIEYRDVAVEVLENLFDVEHLECDLQPSDEYLIEKSGYNEWLESYKNI